MRSPAVSKLLVVATFLVVCTFYAQQADAENWFACIRTTIYDRVLSAIESRSEVVKYYKMAVEAAANKYEQYIADPNTVKPKDAKEQENLFLKFVAERVRDLQGRIGNYGFKNEDVKQLESELQACGPDKNFDESKWGDWNPEKDLDDETFDAVAKEHKSFEDLKQLEAEMGLALDEKTRESLKIRTKSVLMDLLRNEATQIASAVLSAYFTSGGTGLFGVVVPFLPAIKLRVVEFLLNAIVDVVKMRFGQELEVKPVDPAELTHITNNKQEPVQAESVQPQPVPVQAESVQPQLVPVSA